MLVVATDLILQRRAEDDLMGAHLGYCILGKINVLFQGHKANKNSGIEL